MANVLPNKRNVLIKYEDVEEKVEEMPEEAPVLERQDADISEESDVFEEEEVVVLNPPADEDIFNVKQPLNMVPVKTEPKKKKKKQLSDKQKAHLAKIRKIAAEKRRLRKEEKQRQKEEKKKLKEQKKKEKAERSKAWRAKRGLPLEGKINNVKVDKQEVASRGNQLYQDGYKTAWSDFMGYMERYDKLKQEKKANRKYKQNRINDLQQPTANIPAKPKNRWDGRLW